MSRGNRGSFSFKRKREAGEQEDKARGCSKGAGNVYLLMLCRPSCAYCTAWRACSRLLWGASGGAWEKSVAV